MKYLPLLLIFFSISCKNSVSTEQSEQESTNETTNIDNKTWKEGILIDEFIYEEAPFPSVHAATIAETPEGLVAAFFGGTHERNPDVEIWVSRQENGSWTAPESVADGVEDEETRYPTWNPVLFQIPDGDLLLFYKVGPKPSEWWGVMKTSSDHGQTWSEAKKLPENYIGPVKNKPILIDGELICPTSTEGDGWNVRMEMTPDFGETWSMSEQVPRGENDIDAIQPSILIHEDGKLQILCRSRSRAIATSWSEDNGKTWSPMQLSNLPNNNSGTDAVTMENGQHVLVYNHVLPPGEEVKGPRTPLNVSLSDDGINWNASLVLEDSEISQYSYPSVIQSSDGMLHFVYTWRREKIKYVKVDPSKLTSIPIEDGKWPGAVEEVQEENLENEE